MKKYLLAAVTLLLSLGVMAQVTNKRALRIYYGDEVVYTRLISMIDSITFNIEDSEDIILLEANGHDYVDLGLPSGTLWATMNVGAESPEDYGDYFAWGEVESKEYYKRDTYKWFDQDNDNVTKYCIDADYGIIDNRNVLELSDDAARVNWGGSWRIPTEEELLELWRSCDFTWTTQNGVTGYRVVSRSNGNSVFLPAAGFRIHSDLDSEALNCRYWSSTARSGNGETAFSYMFNNQGLGVGDFYRYYGLSIRPVLQLEHKYTIKFNANGGEGNMSSVSAEYATLITLPKNMYKREGYEFVGWNTNADGSGEIYKDSQTFSISSEQTLYAQWIKDELIGTEEGYDYVDLGLPSGTLWATMNVGAESPEDYGDYFAWGEVESKTSYSWENYKWLTEGMTSWDGLSKYTIRDGQEEAVWYFPDGRFKGDDKSILDIEDDVANVKWGGEWRMPTSEELSELIDNCTTSWETLNGVNGYRFTASNGKSIFLPAAGYYVENHYFLDSGSYGSYWASDLSTVFSYFANYISFYSDNISLNYDDRTQGFTVRPVLSK